MSFCAGLFILFYGLQHQTEWTFLLQILVAKFGIASAFNIIYLAHGGLFPVMFAASSFGYCNFFARTFTIASPLLARIEQPLPMIFFTAAAGTSSILALFIQV